MRDKNRSASWQESARQVVMLDGRRHAFDLAGSDAELERMVDELQRCLDDNERRFLLSLVAGTPDWPLQRIAHLEHLPGIG